MQNLPGLFSDEMMINHMKNQSLMDNHRIQLIKLIPTIYLNIPGHFFNIEHSPYLFPMFSFKNTGQCMYVIT
jgi:hypothetical protein